MTPGLDQTSSFGEFIKERIAGMGKLQRALWIVLRDKAETAHVSKELCFVSCSWDRWRSAYAVYKGGFSAIDTHDGARDPFPLT